MKDKRGVEVVFFDAVGTLIHLPKGVGYHYRMVAECCDIRLDETILGNAFRAVWRRMPARPTTKRPRPDDDKGWWRELVRRVLASSGMRAEDKFFDRYFEALYRHFASPGVWELFPEALETISWLARDHRLAVISNFDGRLRVILDQLGVIGKFEKLIISSEVGADKPDPYIFQHALELTGVTPARSLHVGDDPENDWNAAETAGMKTFRLERPKSSLADLARLECLQ